MTAGRVEGPSEQDFVVSEGPSRSEFTGIQRVGRAVAGLEFLEFAASKDCYSFISQSK